MKSRLQILLNTEGIASSKFAEVIGVNRSSISHILSGRNNPSLDFLQKVLIKFPHINPDWLILGQGNMLRNENNKNKAVSLDQMLFNDHGNDNPKEPIKQSKNGDLEINNPANKVTFEEPSEKVSIKDDNTIETPKEKEVKQIVVFYKDGTFDAYIPN